jgi:hypothetical protein
MSFLLQLILILLAMIGASVFFVWLFVLRYKHTFIVKEFTGGKYVCHKFKFREKLGKANEVVFQFSGRNKFAPLKGTQVLAQTVPSRAIELDKKGRKFVTATWSESKQFQFQKTPAPHNFVFTKDRHDFTVQNEILTADSLASYLRHEKEAESYRRKDKLDRIVQLAQLGTLLTIIVGVLIFAPEAMKAYRGEVIGGHIEVTNKLGDVADKLDGAMRRADEIINEKRWIDTDIILNQDGELVVQPNTPPPD